MFIQWMPSGFVLKCSVRKTNLSRNYCQPCDDVIVPHRRCFPRDSRPCKDSVRLLGITSVTLSLSIKVSLLIVILQMSSTGNDGIGLKIFWMPSSHTPTPIYCMYLPAHHSIHNQRFLHFHLHLCIYQMFLYTAIYNLAIFYSSTK